MIVTERGNLTPVKVLISNSLTHLELFENNAGNLFLASPVIEPEGVVYYATTASLFCEFLEGVINLQTLFNKSPSRFVEISSKNKTALYSRNDIWIGLKCGDKTIEQLTNSCPMEIWKTKIKTAEENICDDENY